MGSDDINHAWWPRPSTIKPLDALKTVLRCLQAGDPVPADAAQLVATALQKYLDGQHDITANLGLRPRRGGRYDTPMAIERAEKRNTAIKRLVDLQEGSQSVRCQKVADLLKDVPDAGRITESEVMAYTIELHREFGRELPTSMRQIWRISHGK